VDNELEVIHHQMEDTRASLAEKLDTLENEILGTVHEATAAVANTVEGVKSAVGSVTETMQETVESVKETLNLREQVRRHPWGMLGGAAAAGFFGGWLLGPSRREPEATPATESWREPLAPVREKPAEPAAESSSLLAPLLSLKGVVLGGLMGMVRDMISDIVPENMKAEVANALDEFTTQLGGKPLSPAEEAPAENGKRPERKERGNGRHGVTERTGEGEEPTEPTGRDRGGPRFR